MIRTESGIRVISCDSCSEEQESLEGRGSTFSADMDAWKEEGWRVFKEGDSWRHSCPGCVEEWKSSR